MSHPVIGITTRTAPVPPSSLPSVMLQQSYTNAIRGAGGIPVLIPSDIGEENWETVLGRFDGLLFTGGSDIDPQYFNGVPHPAVYGIDKHRDSIELGFTRAAAAKGIPFLGICRGIQVINVALGGTLYTHIPDQLPGALQHDYPGEDGIPARTTLAHPVRLESESEFKRIVQEGELRVNSLHHQGIKDISTQLNAAAYSPDGLVEAVELPGHPFGVAVQWHPEWLTDQEPTQRLFKAFVAAAGRKR